MSHEDPFERIHDLLSKGKLEEALNHLYAPQKDDVKPPYRSDLNHAWYLIGDIYYRQGAYDRAAAAFERAVAEWPEDGQAHMALGNTFSELGQFERAENCYRTAVKTAPESEDATYNLANVMFDQEKYKDSIALYEKISDLETEVGRLARKNLKLAKARLKEHG